MKLLFFGTPEEAVPFLQDCAEDHEILAVVTRPDRPAGRGLALQAPPVKRVAAELGIPALQPEKPAEIVDRLRELHADAAVVVAYGKILSREALETTRLGFVNVHFSLLPLYRGAAPIERALIGGEPATGVTVFWLDEGMDTGPVLSARETRILDEEDAVGLKARLIALGRETLRDALKDVAGGRVLRTPQTGRSTVAPKITREQAEIDFELPAASIDRLARALVAGPRAFFRLSSGSSVALVKARLEPDAPPAKEAVPGTVVAIERERGILIQCRPGRIWVVVVQPEGKRQIPAADFANGLRLKPGDRLVCFPHGKRRADALG